MQNLRHPVCLSMLWEGSTCSFCQKPHIFHCNLRGKVGRPMEHMGRHLSFYLHGDLDSLKIVTAINMAFEVRSSRLPLPHSYQCETRTFHSTSDAWALLEQSLLSLETGSLTMMDRSVITQQSATIYIHALIIWDISMKTWIILTNIVFNTFGWH